MNMIIFDHATFLKSEFSSDVNEENKKLPIIFLMSKLQKHPSKAKFMVTVTKCSFQHLS